ncbi:TlyA family RNA methyltransferase [Desulfocurvibacter africanus]|uniref:Hemolysin A n=1 Tax=Desulfocurvibacter africanus subsp. africanus str. Walvis Bay TaxID=690850 RepID=F3Z3G6_DESAF|nr:TlyA family RNA methyltransferase [Desulfocurvibacter africanus]EGJ51506.1 hemolysin A [Desulfocurvibacter africanus subsp. africanus str. Walvis Bay]
MAKKIRADQALYEQGLVSDREKATRLIMAGQVLLERGGRLELVAKPGQQVALDDVLVLKEGERFVSRGGYKLLTAIEEFELDFTDLVVLDAGASTGGFTDCALQHGARRVYAVDVGTHQLHEKLRQDPRVVSLEGVNLRHAGPELIPEAVDAVVADVSFISLTLVLPACMRFLKPGGLVVALVKPQFELEPHEIGKGVVRDESLQRKAVDKIIAFADQELSLSLSGVAPSRIKGPKGNQEYLACFQKPA